MTESKDLARRVETPSSNWSADGKPDPHGKTYDCERAGLHMGNMTDDELANGAFLNYDQPLNVAGILAGTCHSPIAWMTAVKDRIRWLSRSLEKVAAERDALAAELKALREHEPFCADDERFRGAFDASIHQGNWPSARKGYGYRSPMTQMAWKVAFSTVCKLGLYALPAPAESAIESSPKPVSPDLLESARAVVARWDAPTWKDLPATAEYIGRLRVAIAQADLDGALTAEGWVVKNVSGSAGLVRAMVIRAEAEESSIETPAKVSPCAGHAVQQEAGHEND